MRNGACYDDRGRTVWLKHFPDDGAPQRKIVGLTYSVFNRFRRMPRSNDFFLGCRNFSPSFFPTQVMCEVQISSIREPIK